MFVLEYKIQAKPFQYRAIDEAIRTTQLVRNQCLRYWMERRGAGKYDLNKHCKQLAEAFEWAKKLSSQARQSAAERAWSAINRFDENCKKQLPGQKGFPKFQKKCRSVEYKASGWKLDPNTKKHIAFTDGNRIGRVKLMGSRDIYCYSPEQIKRVRLVRRADGYSCQLCINIDVKQEIEPAGQVLGIDVGLAHFYTDSNGHQEPNPRLFRKGEKAFKRAHRRLSRKKKKTNNRKKARQRLAKKTLKITRQRLEHAKRLARCVLTSNDVVADEDLKVQNLVQNRHLAKSISEVGWYQFRVWLEDFGAKLGKITVAVAPHYTSQQCCNCERVVKKSLSTRTHTCQCGCQLDRDENAAIKILKQGLRPSGHEGSYACGDETCDSFPVKSQDFL